MNLRSALYFAARRLGDWHAAVRGKLAERLARVYLLRHVGGWINRTIKVAAVCVVTGQYTGDAQALLIRYCKAMNDAACSATCQIEADNLRAVLPANPDPDKLCTHLREVRLYR